MPYASQDQGRAEAPPGEQPHQGLGRVHHREAKGRAPAAPDAPDDSGSHVRGQHTHPGAAPGATGAATRAAPAPTDAYAESAPASAPAPAGAEHTPHGPDAAASHAGTASATTASADIYHSAGGLPAARHV